MTSGSTVLSPLAVRGAAADPARRKIYFAGWWRLIEELGAVPRVLVWDGEGGIGRWCGGRSELAGPADAASDQEMIVQRLLA